MSGEQEAAWQGLSGDEVLERLHSSRSGLTSDEAERRLGIYGPNTLTEEEKASRLRIFLRQFRSVLIFILLVASAISLAVGEYIDFLAILVILIFNAILGFVQEWQAERAIEALKQMLGLRTMVLREGRETEIEAARVVPGDIVVLGAGSRVPADMIMLESATLLADEAPLTGESIPREKAPGVCPPGIPKTECANLLFMGTSVVNGHGKGVVITTGMATEFGRIAGLTQTIGMEQTPLARRMDVLGRQLGLLTVGIAALVVIIGILQMRDLLEMFLIGVTLAVAVIPEGLPAVVTLTLAIGVKQLYRNHCLVRHLAASETLGSVSMICTDKTGTLTRNEMMVQKIATPGMRYEVSGSGYTPEGEFFYEDEAVDPTLHPDLTDVLSAAYRASTARLVMQGGDPTVIGSPTEAALVVAAHKAGIPPVKIPPVQEFSFDSTRKRMTVIYQETGGAVAYVKGAPEVILPRSGRLRIGGHDEPLTDERRTELTATYESLAQGGLRVLAVAYRLVPADLERTPDTIERDLVFLGFAGIIDPPRPEAKDALRLCRTAGIGVIMITGDSALTARAVAGSVGLESTEVLTGKDLDEMSDDELGRALRTTRILARTTPAHKVRVIEVLNRNGHSVAMTGDGVNDAPALKRAQIGIAMGIKGTDVAREASDMVLVDDNFASIVAGVKEGRREYDNISKFTTYLLSSNVGEVIAITGALVMNLPLILLPVQILWINLITDGISALALGVEPAEKDIMEQKPRDPGAPLLSRGATTAIFLRGIFAGAATIFLFVWSLPAGLGQAQTMAFAGLVIFELLNVLNFRSFRYPLARIGLFSNRYLVPAILFSVTALLLIVYLPALQVLTGTTALAAADWVFIILLGLPPLVVGEIYKAVTSRPVPAGSPADG
ncbi:MAG: cation-transporting P-type ATPase [Methanomicrobiales archaeon]|nr:cation-transporting P-type ATPase [Methanomicrobiales archaeon]